MRPRSPSTLWTPQEGASVPRRGPAPPRRRSLQVRRGRGRCLWAWLLLSVLVFPGVRSFLSEEQEELLVELHNHYRGQVSPSASAMLPLKWDASLKVIAEGYAAKCVWSHNPELDETGENLFAGTGPLDLRVALEKWFLEHLDYDYHNNSCHEEKMCGHYTQMVWADTHRVGCAFHLCNNMEGLDWERVSFLVCNYYPAGNYEGERPYVEGDWCSRCPDNLQKCENNLCVADTEEEDDEGTVVPPPATSDPFIQPDATPAPSAPSTTRTTTTRTTTTRTTSTSSREDSSPGPTTPPPVPSTTPGEEEEQEEEERKEEETKEEERKEERKEEVRKEEERKEERKEEVRKEERKEEVRKEERKEEVRKEEERKEERKEEPQKKKAGSKDRTRMMSGSSSLSPPLLSLCLTGILLLRL